MFSERQLNLIESAKSLGFGYFKFATNVEKQGFCSKKQEEALSNMISAGVYRKNNWKSTCGRYKSKTYKHDISDCEAMQSGDYF